VQDCHSGTNGVRSRASKASVASLPRLCTPGRTRTCDQWVRKPLTDNDTAENKLIRETCALPNVDENEAKSADVGVVTFATDRVVDPVEAALTKALEGATAAGEWSTVAQLARELEARRIARVGVVKLDDVRVAKKNGGRS
jgi:hypothetical protein